jgi:hypothetical protein
MNKIKVPTISVLSAILLLVLHLWGMESELYVKYWFYDIILHLLGGASIALAIYTIAEVFNISILKKFYVLVLLTFIAGIAWEVFEAYFDITGFHIGTREYNIDTLKDVVNDTLGAIAVGLILYIRK